MLQIKYGQQKMIPLEEGDEWTFYGCELDWLGNQVNLIYRQTNDYLLLFSKDKIYTVNRTCSLQADYKSLMKTVVYPLREVNINYVKGLNS